MHACDIWGTMRWCICCCCYSSQLFPWNRQLVVWCVFVCDVRCSTGLTWFRVDKLEEKQRIHVAQKRLNDFFIVTKNGHSEQSGRTLNPALVCYVWGLLRWRASDDEKLKRIWQQCTHIHVHTATYAAPLCRPHRTKTLFISMPFNSLLRTRIRNGRLKRERETCLKYK